MTYSVNCKDLGIEGCDHTVTGETPGDVIRKLVPLLRDEHDLDMPDAEDILAGRESDDPLFEQDDEGVVTVIQRLYEKLDLPGDVDDDNDTTIYVGPNRQRM